MKRIMIHWIFYLTENKSGLLFGFYFVAKVFQIQIICIFLLKCTNVIFNYVYWKWDSFWGSVS